MLLWKYIFIIYVFAKLLRYEQSVTQDQFLSGTDVWIRIFLFLDWLPNEGYRIQSTLQFTYSYEKNRWIRKSISTSWNANSAFLDLNWSRQFQFLQR